MFILNEVFKPNSDLTGKHSFAVDIDSRELTQDFIFHLRNYARQENIAISYQETRTGLLLHFDSPEAYEDAMRVVGPLMDEEMEGFTWELEQKAKFRKYRQEHEDWKAGQAERLDNQDIV